MPSASRLRTIFGLPVLGRLDQANDSLLHTVDRVLGAHRPVECHTIPAWRLRPESVSGGGQRAPAHGPSKSFRFHSDVAGGVGRGQPAGLLNHSVADAFPALGQKNIRIIWGREARITPLSDAEAFLAANAHAELTVFDKSGMTPQDEQAQGFNRLAVEILTEEAPKRRTRATKKEHD